jgi:glutaredoxin
MSELKQCSICLLNDSLVKNFQFSCKCSVLLHKDCLDEWFKKNSNCIYCRKLTQVVANKEPEYIAIDVPDEAPPRATAPQQVAEEQPRTPNSRLKILCKAFMMGLTFAIVLVIILLVN